MNFRNPILPGFTPDPSICRAGDDYYLVNSSFEYFPGVPVYHSRDLVNWELIGHCLTRKSQLNLEKARSSEGIFAPTIRYQDGRFYMVTTNMSGLGNFYVWTDDPAGEWSEPIQVKQGGIDPSLLFHEGKTYFCSAMNAEQGIGAYLSEIDIENGELLTEPHFLWAGTGGRYPESPHVYPWDGYFYLLLAEGGTEFAHTVTIARSQDIFGPYESCPQNPILTHRGTWSEIQSTGHGDFVQDPQGRWWIAFLAARHVGYPPVHHMGRETCLARVDWPTGDWPSINGGAPLPIEMALPEDWKLASLPPKPKRDDFDSPQLALEWKFRRNPVADSWSLTRKAGCLSLHCQKANIDDQAPMSFVGRKQELFSCVAQTRLDFLPVTNEEAGLTVMMNERYYAALVVTERDGNRVAFVRRRFGSLRVESKPFILHPQEPTELRIRAEREWYHLEVSTSKGWEQLESVETRHLSTEIAGGFLGVFFGLFASSNQQESENWANFDWFELSATGE